MVAAYEAALLELDLSSIIRVPIRSPRRSLRSQSKARERDPVLLRERAIEALSGLPPDAASA
jgi:hypothetical protein